jgi:hypothetical protein
VVAATSESIRFASRERCPSPMLLIVCSQCPILHGHIGRCPHCADTCHKKLDTIIASGNQMVHVALPRLMAVPRPTPPRYIALQVAICLDGVVSSPFKVTSFADPSSLKQEIGQGLMSYIDTKALDHFETDHLAAEEVCPSHLCYSCFPSNVHSRGNNSTLLFAISTPGSYFPR